MHIPNIYYFFVADCEHNTHGKVKTMPKIEFEFDLQNVFGNQASPFPYEEEGQLQLHLTFMIIFALLLAYNVYSYFQFHKLFERIDSPHFGVTIGLYL